MELILVVVAFLFLLAGLLGAIIPGLPGPPLSYAGLLLLQWSGYGGFSPAFLVLWAVITVAVTITDNILPAWMTKRFGGSRMAVVGSVVGIVAGLFFFPPIGLLIGPFLGALAGELLNNQMTNKTNGAGNLNAIIVALGAFLAFIVGTGAKLIVGSLMIYYAVRAVFQIS